MALNYRYQLVANDKVAIAPRVSLSLPTGNSKKALGIGGVGFRQISPSALLTQANL
jgi:hypothetical protein